MLFSKKNLAAVALFSALAGGAAAQEQPNLQDTATLDEFKRDFAAQTRDIPGSRFMAVTSAQATEEDKKLLSVSLRLSSWATFNEHDQGITKVTLATISQPDVLKSPGDLNQTAERIVNIFKEFDRNRSVVPAPDKPEGMNAREWQNNYHMQQFADKVEEELGVTLTVITIEVPNPDVTMHRIQKVPQGPAPR